MPLTRSQTAEDHIKHEPEENSVKIPKIRKSKTGVKRELEKSPKKEDSPPLKRVKIEKAYNYMTGVIERGHVYFFYRPKVEHEEAYSIDDVKNLHMLLVPRPPRFSTHQTKTSSIKVDRDTDEEEAAHMEVLAPGADAIPAPETLDQPKKPFRLIIIGKKHLPDPEIGGAGKGRKQTFWATVISVGDDLHALEEGLGEKTYETKTLGAYRSFLQSIQKSTFIGGVPDTGTRHQAPARLAARGAYALINNDPQVPSRRATHFGYHISHPSPSEFGDVQKELGIAQAGSFILQVKNPLAPATAPRQSRGKGAEYPEGIMSSVFGKEHEGKTKGRESYGLRFAACETQELLDYRGAELLFIAARAGEEGLEESLGEGRGEGQ
ncbi:hypothetical protein H0H92_012762 [Tricholoma furcatifolium]|nr:hypothetical protein H0H92_012762 [Tricholoma furcatifolium]